MPAIEYARSARIEPTAEEYLARKRAADLIT
jgi:hypothetical protein